MTIGFKYRYNLKIDKKRLQPFVNIKKQYHQERKDLLSINY